jgi:hypothetical protein
MLVKFQSPFGEKADWNSIALKRLLYEVFKVR